MREVKDKVAFVTGGSSGLGLGVTRALVDAGMRVAFSYRTESHMRAALKYFESVPERVHAINADVSNRAEMRRAAEDTVRTFGKVNMLVNNAGVLVPSSLPDTTYNDWDWVMSVNVGGAFNGVKEFLPLIQAANEGGQVVFASSVLGLFCSAGVAAYSASKFAILGMAESLRASLAGSDIGVSVYCPGSVISDIFNSERNRPGSPAYTPMSYPETATEDRVMDPLEAGRLIVRGIRSNKLYIFTHPEYLGVVEERCHAILASFSLQPQTTSVRSTKAPPRSQSIYATAIETKCRN